MGTSEPNDAVFTPNEGNSMTRNDNDTPGDDLDLSQDDAVGAAFRHDKATNAPTRPLEDDFTLDGDDEAPPMPDEDGDMQDEVVLQEDNADDTVMQHMMENAYSTLNKPKKGPYPHIRENVIRYNAKANNDNANLQPKWKAGIELMHLLDKEGASLALFNKLMDWHVKHSYCMKCDRITQEKVKDGDLFKYLRNRYNMNDLLPHKIRTKLPHSKIEVDAPCHDAAAMIRDLLTDPRI